MNKANKRNVVIASVIMVLVLFSQLYFQPKELTQLMGQEDTLKICYLGERQWAEIATDDLREILSLYHYSLNLEALVEERDFLSEDGVRICIDVYNGDTLRHRLVIGEQDELYMDGKVYTMEDSLACIKALEEYRSNR